MSTLLRISAIFIFLAGTATALGYIMWYKPETAGKNPGFAVKYNSPGKPAEKYKLPVERLQTISAELKSFSEKKGYNNEIAFLVDMNIPSGRRRFFVYNMKKDSIELAGLVTHGYGSAKSAIEFSNVPGSYCTSLGRYKVGASYNGRFGLAFKLHGLDKTNDKAFERFVVLHAHDCVPAEEVEPLSICESQGCPTVAPAFLLKLKSFIDASSKPILLNIYH